MVLGPLQFLITNVFSSQDEFPFELIASIGEHEVYRISYKNLELARQSLSAAELEKTTEYIIDKDKIKEYTEKRKKAELFNL